MQDFLMPVAEFCPEKGNLEKGGSEKITIFGRDPKFWL